MEYGAESIYGVRECELWTSRIDLDQGKAERGGLKVKPAQRVDWGSHSGYLVDPAAFLWEVTWNPHYRHA